MRVFASGCVLAGSLKIVEITFKIRTVKNALHFVVGRDFGCLDCERILLIFFSAVFLSAYSRRESLGIRNTLQKADAASLLSCLATELAFLKN